jgi:hypothetical protein
MTYILIEIFAYPPAEWLWALDRDSSIVRQREKKREFALVFRRAPALFFSRSQARKGESAKKARALTSVSKPYLLISFSGKCVIW